MLHSTEGTSLSLENSISEKLISNLILCTWVENDEKFKVNISIHRRCCSTVHSGTI